jgi:tetratricopeptide (TPR) repeat protein
VDLNPEDVQCRRLLALSLGQHSVLYRTAERHFIKALELDPHDLDLRYRLALYYRRLGLAARAQVQLEAVLAAYPEHDGARRELQALRH